MFKKISLSSIIALLLGAVNFYITLPAINIKDSGFWSLILFMSVVFIITYFILNGSLKFKINNYNTKNHVIDFKKPIFKKSHKNIFIIAFVIILITGLSIWASSTKIFNASKYQKMLPVENSNFTEDIAELPINKIPIVDKDSAERLGSRKIGEVVELVSQFNVSDYYTQINYKETPYRVSPLEYADFIKWLGNKKEGVPYYVKIDMASQNTELVKLDKGMKYLPSEYFDRDLLRHVRFAYPTKMFHSTSFEIDEEGNPFFVISYYEYTIGFLGGKDIAGVLCVNAVTGEINDYPVKSVPSWVDRVYDADIVLEQANSWGSFTEGYINSILGQKNVIQTTDGYNYIALNDDVWLFTGITSVVSDESNIGFLLINMRTKESKRYSINGAEEYSAMSSAEGKIQEKKYTATFPILINIADTPSYFISLKDNAGLVKAYSFVSVSNYQIVGVADTLEGASEEYLRLLNTNGVSTENEAIVKKEIIVDRINSAVIDGNSVYYIKPLGSDKIYSANIDLSTKLPLIKEGDKITISIYDNENITTINAIE